MIKENDRVAVKIGVVWGWATVVCRWQGNQSWIVQMRNGGYHVVPFSRICPF